MDTKLENPGLDYATQNAMILQALKTEPRGLSGLDMLRRFGVLSHTRRITDLRQKGIPVADFWECQFDENGKTIKRWKRYFLPAEARRDA